MDKKVVQESAIFKQVVSELQIFFDNAGKFGETADYFHYTWELPNGLKIVLEESKKSQKAMHFCLHLANFERYFRDVPDISYIRRMLGIVIHNSRDRQISYHCNDVWLRFGLCRATSIQGILNKAATAEAKIAAA